jgi:hypothetical protein
MRETADRVQKAARDAGVADLEGERQILAVEIDLQANGIGRDQVTGSIGSGSIPATYTSTPYPSTPSRSKSPSAGCCPAAHQDRGTQPVPQDFGATYWRLGSVSAFARHYDVPHLAGMGEAQAAVRRCRTSDRRPGCEEHQRLLFAGFPLSVQLEQQVPTCRADFDRLGKPARPAPPRPRAYVWPFADTTCIVTT